MVLFCGSEMKLSTFASSDAPMTRTLRAAAETEGGCCRFGGVSFFSRRIFFISDRFREIDHRVFSGPSAN